MRPDKRWIRKISTLFQLNPSSGGVGAVKKQLQSAFTLSGGFLVLFFSVGIN